VKAAPSTENAAPRANRALDDNCAVAAATAVNTRPEAASATPKATEPLGGMSRVRSPALLNRPANSDAALVSTNVAVSAAYRPTAVESSSSVRPASSSPRVCRMTVRMTPTAMRRWNIPAFHTPTAPTDSL
jgi:hypothetical protein